MKKPQAATAHRPHQCVIMGIDPSNASSGCATFTPSGLHSCAVALTACDRFLCVQEAQGLATKLGLPLVFVIEDWGGFVKSTQTAFGMGSARGKWLQEIERIGYREDHVVWMPLSTWRSRIGFKRMADSDAYKRAAVQRVKLEFGIAVVHDVAEAALIAKVASLAPETAVMLSKISRARKKLEAA